MPFKKGLIPWNKGKTNVYSKETLEKISLSHKGKPSPMKGKNHKLESNQKNREAHLGKIAWNKGIPMREESKLKLSKSLSTDKNIEKARKLGLSNKGKVRTPIQKHNAVVGRQRVAKEKGYYFSEEVCKKLSLINKGRIPWSKGRTGIFSQESLQKMSKSHMGSKNPFYGKHHTETTKEKFTKRKNGPFKDTIPERMMQIALKLQEIPFTKHKPIKLGRHWHQVDIFIEPNIVVEVDGIHWHLEDKDIKRDLRQTQELTIMGYHIIRIRDKDILKDANKPAENVIRLIKELQHNFLANR